MIDVIKLKKDFPIFRHDPSLVYLDSTATTLKPQCVIDSLKQYYEEYSANIFRGIYRISEKATAAYESTRETVAEFINANSSNEIVFTRNTTESINLAVYSYVLPRLNRHDEIAVTLVEHHSNFVPWQQIALKKRAKFTVLGIDRNGIFNDIETAVNKRTKILALTMKSNVLGLSYDVRSIIQKARRINPAIIVVVDAAQAVGHQRLDAAELGADFIAFSSHKMLGPTGIGVLWAKEDLLQAAEPFLYGGEMIREVRVDATEFKDAPHKFEAGTPAIAETIALSSAVNYLKKVGLEKIEEHEKKLGTLAAQRLRAEFPQIRILGPEDRSLCGGIISFYFENIHAHDIAQVLSDNNICVRAGNHCAMPLHTGMGIDATVRVSLYMYNDKGDIDRLVKGLHSALQILERTV
jgi:cysteine desulfurase/selenocysteine lyase